VDPEMEKYPDWSAYNYTMYNPIKLVDPDGRNPKLAKMLIKTAWKTYNKLKKAGKFSKDNFIKALKDSGMEEIMDVAGDLFTIVDPTAGWIDKAQAILDLGAGTEFNNKGNKAAEEAFDKATDLVRGSKKVNKNSNDAEGNFVIYQVKDLDTDKKLKIGKANKDDIMPTTGEVRRVATSERKAKKAGYPNAKGEIIEDLGKTTTKKAKEVEAKTVRSERAAGNELPLNKERDKSYKPN
jgi:hypothetical protein